jgi:acetate---CoA ligase (ADP-forming)
VVFRICPITDADAEEMIDSIRGAALLRGHRGSPAVDRQALVEVLLRVSAMAEAHPEIVELDINPLLARAEGDGAVVVDARLRLEPPAPTAP